ncbi:Hap3p [Sugiyamaella lignohabitans]|uniref:Hap3p n=1 Tax=Sugiyamaella lignohabitans TaxID=796027 RepID=A0A167BZJ3_9ASCO|nr:Hap3p [Sugiyamaella lignohabitans]ANB11022.1 Hap3p [Sugiyamaella lignohabitans]
MDKSPPDSSKNFELREQDKWLPIANVSRIMKNALPESAKVSKEAKECVQECVSEFVSFITSEASEKCSAEKRKTVNGEDILFAMTSLGFENYAEVLKIYLAKYREFQVLKQEREGDRKPSGGSGAGLGRLGNGGSSVSVGLDEDEDDDMDSGSGGVVMDNASESLAADGAVAEMLNTDGEHDQEHAEIKVEGQSGDGSEGAVATTADTYTNYDDSTYTTNDHAPAATDDPSIYEDYGQYTNVDMNQF